MIVQPQQAIVASFVPTWVSAHFVRINRPLAEIVEVLNMIAAGAREMDAVLEESVEEMGV